MSDYEPRAHDLGGEVRIPILGPHANKLAVLQVEII